MLITVMDEHGTSTHSNQALADKRKNLKMNLNHFNASSNTFGSIPPCQRNNLPKITPFNQQLLIEKSRERLKLTQSIQSSGRLEVSPNSVYDFTSDDLQDLGEIGRGGFGTVNKMVHRKSNTVMAVKRIRSTIDEKEQKILLMDLDVVMKSNDCPYIVKFYGALFKEGDCWICMQLMDTSLDKFYKFIYEKLNQRIPENIIGKITVATVKALNYLKQNLKIIHRDVKPSNILLDKQGNIKLCDFGISGQLVDSIARTRDAGCRPYMAPERIDPQTAKGYDVRSDVWSLGITLMEVSTGHFPYPKWNTVFEQLNQVVKGDPPRLSPNENGNSFTLEFVQFVNTCLIKDENQRPKYNALLQHPFIKRSDEERVDVALYIKLGGFSMNSVSRFRYPDIMDEWKSSLAGGELEQIITKESQKIPLEAKSSENFKVENSMKDAGHQPLDVKRKNKNDQALLLDSKSNKNLKVHSFLRNLRTRIMKTFQFVIVTRIVTSPYPDTYRSQKETKFLCPGTQTFENFPSIEDSFQINLSVVVPAYNEEERLPPMLNECLAFLEKRHSLNSAFKYEVIVVSDGSQDKTVKVALKYSEKYGSDKVRVLELEKNRGKGGAVYMGVQSSRGAVILFADADGASKFEDITKLESALEKLIKCDYLKEPNVASEAEAIVCGSRAHLEEAAIANRSFFRNILMHGFHFLVWFFAVRTIRDTQCGFKLFTRRAAYSCFKSLHVRRWAFDVELLYIAEQFNIPISEICVRWTEIDGSKLVPFWSWLQMGKDLCFIWFKYKAGAWKLIECDKKK